MAGPKASKKVIKITTTGNLGFQEMSDIKHQIDVLLKKYHAEYEVQYYFK